MWPDRRLIALFNIEIPIVQAPMAGAMDWELAAAAAEAGALGSLPCAMLNTQQVREQMGKIRARTKKPINLNFFCHTPPTLSNARETRWRERLAPYYRELGIDPAAPVPSSNRAAFDAAMCDVVEETKPDVVSFHFGLPEAGLLQRHKAAGFLVMSSATTAAEARWLEARGVDAVIAQGYEAGGHRGVFLSDDIAHDGIERGAVARRDRRGGIDRELAVIRRQPLPPARLASIVEHRRRMAEEIEIDGFLRARADLRHLLADLIGIEHRAWKRCERARLGRGHRELPIHGTGNRRLHDRKLDVEQLEEATVRPHIRTILRDLVPI